MERVSSSNGLSKTDAVFIIEKTGILKKHVSGLRMKDKRSMFLLMRSTGADLSPDTFFPEHGLTAGEFAVGQVLSSTSRPEESLDK
jgi:hypothetical protein